LPNLPLLPLVQVEHRTPQTEQIGILSIFLATSSFRRASNSNYRLSLRIHETVSALILRLFVASTVSPDKPRVAIAQVLRLSTDLFPAFETVSTLEVFDFSLSRQVFFSAFCLTVWDSDYTCRRDSRRRPCDVSWPIPLERRFFFHLIVTVQTALF
jgi:hypothetical protein